MTRRCQRWQDLLEEQIPAPSGDFQGVEPCEKRFVRQGLWWAVGEEQS